MKHQAHDVLKLCIPSDLCIVSLEAAECLLKDQNDKPLILGCEADASPEVFFEWMNWNRKNIQVVFIPRELLRSRWAWFLQGEQFVVLSEVSA